MDGKLKLVLVEDNQLVRKSITSLCEFSGCTVQGFRTAEDMLASEADKDEVDCCILDYRLPGMNGLDLMTELRSQGWMNPILLIGGGLKNEVRDKVESSANSACIDKPFRAKEFFKFLKMSQRFAI